MRKTAEKQRWRPASVVALALLAAAGAAWSHEPDCADTRTGPISSKTLRLAVRVDTTRPTLGVSRAATGSLVSPRIPRLAVGAVSLGITDDERAYAHWLHPAARL